VIVYESTVYPGATEEVCVPILEAESGLKWKKDFWVAYSPERVNPGDKTHTIDRVVKIVSGDTPATADLIAQVYGAVIPAGLHRAPDIKTAEAAKIVENVQRDINIALMNELAIIFGRLGLDTGAVLAAAGTKWNFLKFEPGLVGGHCIPVDPYYLTHKAQESGYEPEVILAGRRLNDSMGKYVAEQTVEQIRRVRGAADGAKVLVLGLAFKENVPDLRSSQVPDLCRELEKQGISVYAYDPLAEVGDCLAGTGVCVVDAPETAAPVDAIIVAVRHSAFLDLGMEYFRSLSSDRPVLIDVKGCYSAEEAEEQGIAYWRL
jgi:UDP-N-acetyl-D-galactosamine dehydrogenase